MKKTYTIKRKQKGHYDTITFRRGSLDFGLKIRNSVEVIIRKYKQQESFKDPIYLENFYFELGINNGYISCVDHKQYSINIYKKEIIKFWKKARNSVEFWDL